MKAKLLCLTMLVFLTGCFLISTPTAAVKSFIAATQKGDVDGMTKLFSSKAIQKIGLDKIRADNQSFADTAKRAAASGGSFRMEDILESSTSAGARVSFLYKNETQSLKFVFNLSKESGAWKIDSIGDPGMEGGIGLDTPTESPVLQEPPPLPPPSVKGGTETKTATGSKTISGGILNGKAISLPQPAYPSVAKAVKASGTVMVQVLVDEKGNVVSATAVSGHPLLRAAATAAARSAKFSPTKLSGEPAKVSGVIAFQFSPE